jgi:hypothetical protein
VTEGLSFLGFNVFPERRRLKRRKGIHFQRRLQALYRLWQTGLIQAVDLTPRVQGWVNHVRYGNTRGLRAAVLSGGNRLSPSILKKP